MGFSSIHRCGRTKSQDGFNKPIEYVTADAYCMDGTRLILVSGTYGKDGAEWRTETNQWMQILSHGNGDQGTIFPSYNTHSSSLMPSFF